MPTVEELYNSLQERIQARQAEIAHLHPDEKEPSPESTLMQERELRNVIQCAYDEGLARSMAEALAKEHHEASVRMALQGLAHNLPVELIARTTKLSMEEVYLLERAEKLRMLPITS